MNKVILVGRICNDIELKLTPSGTHVATYTLAVDRRYKKEGLPDTDFLRCVVWGKGAEFAGKYFRKGIKIGVSGSIQTRSYDKQDGQRVYVTEIIVEDQEFCEKKSDAGEGATAGTPNTATANNTPVYSTPYVPSDKDLPPIVPTVGEYEEMAADAGLPF